MGRQVEHLVALLFTQPVEMTRQDPDPLAARLLEIVRILMPGNAGAVNLVRRVFVHVA